jgi:predicted KAP-like P-loop ATPase
MIQVRAEQIAVPIEKPFEFDLLGRKSSAEVLTQFIELAEPPFVLALDSPWGTGKTTFLRMWLQSLTNNRYGSIYFNAWENDFSDDPLVPIMVQFDAYLSEQSLSGELLGKATDYLANAKTIGARLARTIVPAAIKMLTAGAIDADKFINETIADLSERIISSEIEAHKKDKIDLEKFKKNLQGLVGSLNMAKSQPVDRSFLICNR